jgi:hypothetical protein
MTVIDGADTRDALLDRFVASFESADEMIAYDTDPIAQQLAVGQPDEYGFRRWRPKKVKTDASALDAIYSKLPARFPPLFEQLVLSCRWADVSFQVTGSSQIPLART